ncbi:hypothetical protein ADEAN_000534200 [Angomonas deanei]|uniref:Uncharacterized protein n=1 Tax=Angomonas deanei TaxID=59799 RepID=A0A7G2CDE9_9TRYP|nr:hypothetical protein ADEAN_000534200 [Angomonas deanei]
MGRDPQVFADITQVYEGIVSSFLTNSDNLSDDEVVNILMEIKPFIDDLGIDTVGRVVQTCANEGNHKSIPSLLRQADAAQSNPSDPPQNERNADAPLTFIESEKKEKPKSDAKKPEPAPNKEKKKKKGFFSKLFGSKKSKTDEKEDSKEKSREEEKKNQHAHSPQKEEKSCRSRESPSATTRPGTTDSSNRTTGGCSAVAAL